MRTALRHVSGPSVAAAMAIAAMTTAVAAAASPASAPAGKGTCHALLIGGLPGTPTYARHYRDWIQRFHAYLTKTAGVPAGQIVVLSGDKDFQGGIVSGLATAESVTKALADLSAKVRAEDQFILFIVGLGVAGEKSPGLVLPGPDIEAPQLAAALRPIAAGNQAVLNFSASAGDFAPILSAPGRVIVAANTPREDTPPAYAEFFLRGLESARADGQDAPAAGRKDGVITLLEAYHWAAWNTAQWIARQHKAGENVWRVDGKESVEVFRKLYEGPASQDGTRQLAPDSDASGPDKVVRLKLQGNTDEIAKTRRRVITEHACLEDCGAQEPVSALGDEKQDYVPLAGKGEAEPGCLARRVVLGRTDLLPAEGG